MRWFGLRQRLFYSHEHELIWFLLILYYSATCCVYLSCGRFGERKFRAFTDTPARVRERHCRWITLRATRVDVSKMSNKWMNQILYFSKNWFQCLCNSVYFWQYCFFLMWLHAPSSSQCSTKSKNRYCYNKARSEIRRYKV